MTSDHVLHDRLQYQVAIFARRVEQVRIGGVGSQRNSMDRAAFLLLNRLDWQGPTGVKALADALGIDSSTVTRQVAPLVDAGLVERLRARDQSAVSDLADRYSPRIRQLALRYVRNAEDAEEVVQDVLLKVYQKIEAFRGDSALSSWIYRITFNTAMSRLRSLKASRSNGASREAAWSDRSEGTPELLREIPGSGIVAMSFCEPRSCIGRLSS